MRTHIPIFFLLLLITSCQSSPQGPGQHGGSSAAVSTGDSTIVTDDLGRQVLLPQRISRIVPIAPSITEILYEAGADSQIVAVSHADDFPPEVRLLPRFNSFPMDYEALVRLAPDVVIGTDQINNPRDAHLFESLNIPVIYFTFNTWSDVPRIVQYLGRVTGNREQAQRAADSLNAVVESVRQRIPENFQRPRVLLLIGSEQLFAFGRDSYVHELIQVAGGISLTESMDTPSPVLSEEFVISEDPDIIIGTFSNATDLLQHHPSFQTLTAIRTNRLCTVEPSLLLRPGPRLAEGMHALADCISSSQTAAAPPPPSP